MKDFFLMKKKKLLNLVMKHARNVMKKEILKIIIAYHVIPILFKNQVQQKKHLIV